MRIPESEVEPRRQGESIQDFMQRVRNSMMDVQEKRSLVSTWFREFAKDNGFDVILTAESSSVSGLHLQVERSQFPGIDAQTVLPDTLLRNTPPRVLLNELLPTRGRELSQAYAAALRDSRLKR